MYILNFIGEFNIIDIVILVLVIFIFIFLLVLTSSLMKKNKELRKELTKVSKENIHEESIVNNSDELNEDISLYEEDELVDNEEDLVDDDILLEEPKKEEDINDILEALPEIAETGPYKRNVLRELSARGQTSPVNIGKSTVDIPRTKVTSYVKKEEPKKVENKKEDIKKIDEVDNQTFIEEISRRIEAELQPQTIELTDYEKKQEEEAIISYRELIKVKDRLYRINDDEEIDSFIDELKEFRTDLEE